MNLLFIKLVEEWVGFIKCLEEMLFLFVIQAVSWGYLTKLLANLD
jgi:hypothetical protein